MVNQRCRQDRVGCDWDWRATTCRKARCLKTLMAGASTVQMQATDCAGIIKRGLNLSRGQCTPGKTGTALSPSVPATVRAPDDCGEYSEVSFYRFYQ